MSEQNKKPIPLASIYLEILSITIFILTPASPTIALLFGAVLYLYSYSSMTNAIILAFVRT